MAASTASAPSVRLQVAPRIGLLVAANVALEREPIIFGPNPMTFGRTGIAKTVPACPLVLPRAFNKKPAPLCSANSTLVGIILGVQSRHLVDRVQDE